jgi:16S rRNA processing protein RimM
MADTAPALIVVGRVRKPHGLKGELSIFPLTDEPDQVFIAGRTLQVLTLGGAVAGEIVLEAVRGYHREWLLRLRGHDRREAVEGYREHFLAVPRDSLPALEAGEVYQQDLVGYAVRGTDEEPMGIVSAVYDLPAGLTIEVQGPKREFLLPFRGEYVLETDTVGRRLVVTVPDGLLD